MIRELYEDKIKQMVDSKTNDTPCNKYEYGSISFQEKTWKEVRVGDIVAVSQGEEVPADLLFIHSPTNNAFVDTSNMDGETGLNQKFVFKNDINRDDCHYLQGQIHCEPPNSTLDRWSGFMMMNSSKLIDLTIKNFVPRGCIIHDTPFIIGIVLYVGKDTKINQNMKLTRFKESWLIQAMNKTTYTVFLLQFILIIVISLQTVFWQNNVGVTQPQLEHPNRIYVNEWVVGFLVTLISYSHLIPISLYVAVEMLKVILVW